MLYIESCQNYTSTNSVQIQDIVHLTENHHTGKYMFLLNLVTTLHSTNSVLILDIIHLTEKKTSYW